MLAVSYIGILKSDSKIIKENKNTKDAAWFKIDCVPNLAFKHNEIMNEALKKLKSLITESNILKSILPDNFTMPELQKVFESIWKIYINNNRCFIISYCFWNCISIYTII